MTQTLDEFIPEHILVVPCPWCGKIFSAPRTEIGRAHV